MKWKYLVAGSFVFVVFLAQTHGFCKDLFNENLSRIQIFWSFVCNNLFTVATGLTIIRLLKDSERKI